MCLSPITINNPSRYRSLVFVEKLKYRIPCGQCAECKQHRQNEWYYRTSVEYKACVASGGYMLFDCLTYSENNVPRFSRFFKVPRSLDFTCFSHEDFRLFFVRLRRKLESLGYDVANNLKYFLAAEYGTGNYTHRPHYHLLLFVYNNFIPPLVLSRYISDCWRLGRTDGVKYKGSYYVLNRCVLSGNAARVCKYVAKYVVKSSTFQKVLDHRINAYLWFKYSHEFRRVNIDGDYFIDGKHKGYFPNTCKFKDDYSAFCDWCSSPNGKKVRADVKRVVDMFHRQSHNYGVACLGDLDLISLRDSGTIILPDADKVVMRIPLPTYYKRKLFQEKVEIDGKQSWQYHDIGRAFVLGREKSIISSISRRLEGLAITYKLGNFDYDSLAYYLYHYRYSSKVGNILDSSVTNEVRLKYPLIYYYGSSTDMHQFNYKFYSDTFLGNDILGYSSEITQKMDSREFNRLFMRSTDFDFILDKFEQCPVSFNLRKQEKADLIEHYKDVHKLLGIL